MNSITKPDHLDNIGGIIKLWYVPIEDVSSMSRPVKEYGGISLSANAEWHELYFSPQSGSYILEFKTGSKGSLFDCKITGSFPKQTPLNSFLFNQLNTKGFICKILDANGLYRIIGTIDFPLHFAYKFVTGKSPKDKNSIGFAFSCQSKFAPFFLTSQAGSQS